jgi:zinc transport system substrate-binding protein
MPKIISVVLLFIASFMASPVYALNVVVTIPPLAGMIAPLLSNQDTLKVLLAPGASPHDFQLKPLQMWTIQKADLLVAVDNPVDVWAHKALQKFPHKTVLMSSLKGTLHLPVEDEGEHEPSHDSHDHGHLHDNPHIWLSPYNARLLIEAVSLKLQKLEPSRKAIIQQKTQTALASLEVLINQIQQQLLPYQQTPFEVLHDAYEYFNQFFGLQKSIAMQINPSLKPSLKRVYEIQQQIKKEHIRCIFKEPQFPASRVNYVVQGLKVKIDSLDPIGSLHHQESYDKLLGTLSAHLSE